MDNNNIKNRRQIRLLVKKDILINNTIKGYVLDISEGGMFIYTHVLFPKGSLINLNFMLKEGDLPVKIQSCVQFVQERVGIGVVFTDSSQIDKERLKKFIVDNLDAHPLGAEAAAIDTRKKVLLVDDSISAINTYKNKLVFTGFIVREAASGVEAIKILSKEKMDLIVMDLVMEGMDGIKLLQLIRANPEWKDIKVIVLSGRMNTKDAEKIASFGVASLFPKMTTSPNKLADRIKELLG